MMPAMTSTERQLLLKRFIANSPVETIPRDSFAPIMVAKIRVPCHAKWEGSGVRGQGSGVRSQGSGVRSQESGVRSQQAPAKGDCPDYSFDSLTPDP